MGSYTSYEDEVVQTRAEVALLVSDLERKDDAPRRPAPGRGSNDVLNRS